MADLFRPSTSLFWHSILRRECLRQARAFTVQWKSHIAHWRAIDRRPSELWQLRRNFFGVESYCEPTLPTIWPILGVYLRAGREVPVASFCSLRRDFSPVRLVRVEGCFMPADECLTFARECRRWALETKDKDVREAFLEMAKVWTQLGSQQQRLSSDVGDPPPPPRAS